MKTQETKTTLKTIADKFVKNFAAGHHQLSGEENEIFFSLEFMGGLRVHALNRPCPKTQKYINLPTKFLQNAIEKGLTAIFEKRREETLAEFSKAAVAAAFKENRPLAFSLQLPASDHEIFIGYFEPQNLPHWLECKNDQFSLAQPSSWARKEFFARNWENWEMLAERPLSRKGARIVWRSLEE